MENSATPSFPLENFRQRISSKLMTEKFVNYLSKIFNSNYYYLFTVFTYQSIFPLKVNHAFFFKRVIAFQWKLGCGCPCLLRCYLERVLSFRIVAVPNQFFVLHTLSASFKITVLPLK